MGALVVVGLSVSGEGKFADLSIYLGEFYLEYIGILCIHGDYDCKEERSSTRISVLLIKKTAPVSLKPHFDGKFKL